MTNEEIEAHVLSVIPATYQQMIVTIGQEYDRKIDAALQRLRKRGQIEFTRTGRIIVWTKIVSTAADTSVVATCEFYVAGRRYEPGEYRIERIGPAKTEPEF